MVVTYFYLRCFALYRSALTLSLSHTYTSVCISTLNVACSTCTNAYSKHLIGNTLVCSAHHIHLLLSSCFFGLVSFLPLVSWFNFHILSFPSSPRISINIGPPPQFCEGYESRGYLKKHAFFMLFNKTGARKQEDLLGKNWPINEAQIR